MKDETSFWTKVRSIFKLTARSTLKRYGDMVNAGAPDGLFCVEGVSGVLELKYLPAWPKRADTEISIGTGGLSKRQREWLTDWIAAEGRGFVLLGVAEEWFLLTLSEVPLSNKLSRMQLDAIRQQGRAGHMKELRKLPRLVASYPQNMVD